MSRLEYYRTFLHMYAYLSLRKQVCVQAMQKNQHGPTNKVQSEQEEDDEEEQEGNRATRPTATSVFEF